MRVIVDESKCVGAGQCVNAAPAVFAQREEDGVVVLLNETPPAEESQGVQMAVRICPARAIAVD
ncbi:MAG: ferredoxin [Rhizobiaceae bacterium]